MKFKLVEDLELSNEYDSEGNELTKAQVEFFKNSKVRDSKDRLLVCYHGTDKEFNTFDNTKSMRGILEGGLYFTTNKQVGNSYGTNGRVLLTYLDITGYLDLTDYSRDYKQSILEFIPQDQIELGEKYEINSSNYFYFIDLANLVYKYQTYYKNACDVISGWGFDGVKQDNETYIAFNSNQIKSITNKNPSNSNNINEDVNNEPKIIYMPLGRSKVEIIKNPTRKMLRDLDKEQRELHPNIEPYEPVIRFTYGENGNEYIWPAYDAMHDTVERYIYKTFGEKTNQSKSFELFDTYYDDLI